MKKNRLTKAGERQKLLPTLAAVFISILLLFSMGMGCGSNVFEGIADDGSYEARLEEARIALDKAEYEKARDILLQLKAGHPGNAQILEYLSNAYAGLTGIDTFNLLDTIDELDNKNNSGSIDMIGLVLGSTDGTLTKDQIKNKLDNLGKALDTLDEIQSPDDDTKIQKGLLSVTHLALTIGDVITTDQGIDQMDLTEAGIKATYPSSNADIDSNDAPSDTLNDMGQDISRIGDSVTALEDISSAGNDLSDNFTQFQQDIDQNSDTSVTGPELSSYINNL